LPAAEAGYTGGEDQRGTMRVFVVIVAALAVVTVQASHAGAATKKPVVMRSASGTIIEPTKTIIHDGYGHTTVIVIPRRSYLDTGTEVSVGDRKFMDYAMPVGGDPGQSSFWFIGPDVSGSNGYPLPRAYQTPGAPF
jgi:hypothetical protein